MMLPDRMMAWHTIDYTYVPSDKKEQNDGLQRTNALIDVMVGITVHSCGLRSKNTVLSSPPYCNLHSSGPFTLNFKFFLFFSVPNFSEDFVEHMKRSTSLQGGGISLEVVDLLFVSVVLWFA
ncbi:hypothetical protein VNO77_43772 [Canavalia gladiata]|uniref:Uncharacterized protein n=1 Tax=Canavalia gladiata TaxID=3824 RepID=A0AAN9JUU1_CANGL